MCVAASTVTIGNGEWSKQPLDSSDSIVAGDVRIETLIARFRLRRGFIFLRLARTGPVRYSGAHFGVVRTPRVDNHYALVGNDVFADVLAVIAAEQLYDDHQLAKLATDFHVTQPDDVIGKKRNRIVAELKRRKIVLDFDGAEDR